MILFTIFFTVLSAVFLPMGIMFAKMEAEMDSVRQSLAENGSNRSPDPRSRVRP